MKMLSWNRFSVLALASTAAFGLFALGAGCATTPAEHTGEADEHLTAAQCLYFDVNGKDTICHYTGSAKHPYTIVKTSDQGCINGHTGHGHDYIAVGDPTCQGGGCLPLGAPCDATLPCCSGAACEAGHCVELCAPTTCEAQGQACGTLADGCGDTLDCGSCAAGFACNAGQCQNIDDCASNPCQNGGTCTDGVNSYTCACPAGFTGTNCDINIDECASNPCVHGTCTDGVNSYTCACDSGWTGTNCDQPAGPTCPCAADPEWQAALAGTLVTTGPCLNYSFPAPYGSRTQGANDSSWAFSNEGSKVVRLIGGATSTQLDPFDPPGVAYFCGIQLHNVGITCSGSSFLLNRQDLTAAEGEACKAEILAWGQSH
ncbi:MAG: calcium-binding EGF-like domain-containing protein [Minicystis sp.]